ncbi:MAG: hypothetical protein ACYC3O_11480 [Burkholderiales bacterium]
MFHHHINIAYIVVNSLIHAAIYGAVFHLFKDLTTTQAVILAAVVVGLIAAVYAVFKRPNR